MNCNRCPNKDQKYFSCHPVIQTDLFLFSGEYTEVADINLIEGFLKVNCEVRK